MSWEFDFLSKDEFEQLKQDPLQLVKRVADHFKGNESKLQAEQTKLRGELNAVEWKLVSFDEEKKTLQHQVLEDL